MWGGLSCGGREGLHEELLIWGADGAVDVEEHKDLGCTAGCGMGKAVQAWRAQPELVHLSGNGNE